MSDQPPFELDSESAAVLERLWYAGHAAYVVGGAVRDALLGIDSADWDVATDAAPDRLLEIFPGGTYQNRFGTVRVGEIEVTTFRRDHRYADHRRPERVSFSDDVFEDLARRDLTINAIAWGRGTSGGAARLLDPADGLTDLRARVVRAVGDADARFDEDALRLLRAVRIAAHLDFTIEPRTLAAIVDHAADVEWVSEERTAAEVRRMLAADRPAGALQLLRSTGVTAVALPELGALDDPGHTDDVVAAVAGGPRDGESVRLAALIHALDADAGRSTLARLHVREKAADAIVRLAANVHVAADQAAADEAEDDVALRRLLRHLGPETIDDLLVLRRAHAAAAGDADALAAATVLAGRIEAQRAAQVPLSLADLPLDGRDLRDALGIDEGPLVGEILGALLERVIVDPALSERATLIAAARQLLAGTDDAGGRVGSAE